FKSVDCRGEAERRTVILYSGVGRQTCTDYENLPALAASIESPAPERLCRFGPMWNDELWKDQDACRRLGSLLLNECGCSIIAERLRQVAEVSIHADPSRKRRGFDWSPRATAYRK